MIAQDFARVRVLGAFSRRARGGTPSQEIETEASTPYGVARALTRAKVPTVRGRGQRSLYPVGLSKELLSNLVYGGWSCGGSAVLDNLGAVVELHALDHLPELAEAA